MAIPFKVSDESVNSYGFWVKTDGIDLSGFTGVMLYDHNRWDRTLPIGIWENARKVNGELLMDAAFDQDDEYARKIQGKVAKGIIKGASVGLEIIEQSSDAKLMKPGQSRPTVTKSRLYEISITPFPSNKNALRLMHNGKSLNLSENDSDIDHILPLINNNETMKQVALKLGLPETATEQQMVDAVTALEAKASGLQTNLTATFVKLGEATGVIDDKNRDRMQKLLITDFDLALSFLQKPAETTPHAPPQPAKPDESIRLSDLVKELRNTTKPADQEKDYDWYQKNDPTTLNTMRLSKPDKFRKLFEDFYGTPKAE